MATATMTTKGQITIPHEVRSALGLRPGSRIDFTRIDEDTYEITVVTGSIRALKGALSSPLHLSLEEMDDAIAKAAGEPDAS